MDEKLEDQFVLRRFNKACGLFDKYRALDMEAGFMTYDDPWSVYREDRDELATLKTLLAAKGIDAERKEEAEAEIRDVEADIVAAKNAILYNAVVDQADKIYSDVLKYGRMIAKQPKRFGFTLSELEVKMHHAGVCKLDLDLEKEINKEMAEEKLYPETARVEPLFDDALMKYILE